MSYDVCINEKVSIYVSAIYILMPLGFVFVSYTFCTDDSVVKYARRMISFLTTLLSVYAVWFLYRWQRCYVLHCRKGIYTSTNRFRESKNNRTRCTLAARCSNKRFVFFNVVAYAMCDGKIPLCIEYSWSTPVKYNKLSTLRMHKTRFDTWGYTCTNVLSGNIRERAINKRTSCSQNGMLYCCTNNA